MLNAQPYRVVYKNAGNDSSLIKELFLKEDFLSRTEADIYIAGLPSLLQSKGFITGSVDSIFSDSTNASVIIFLGEQYKWARISTQPEYEEVFQAVRWNGNDLSGAVMDFKQLEDVQKRVLDYFEETGYPFAKTYLDSINIDGEKVNALLKINPGPLYKIDSIRVYGDAKVSNAFLQRYLEISNGSAYNKRKLSDISKKISELSYVQEEHASDLTLLGTGSVLNLYLKQKKSSQVNALIGFLPNSDIASGKKFLITGEANILLRNAFGSSETVGLLWQQLQQKSPRLNLFYEQPYVFRSPFGLNFLFDMYRKDSTFLNIILNIGTSYRIEERKTASLFLQRRSTIITPNIPLLLQTRTLQDADVSSLNIGLSYQYNATDYRLNPRRGNEFSITTSAGNKKIKKNNEILELKDPNDPSFKFESLYDTVKLNAYQLKLAGSAAKYFSLRGQNVLKLGLYAGIYQSPNNFRNELFQIGGNKLMRGFDEESQFVSQYGIGTVEYRYLVGRNSNFFAFIDAGWGKHLLESKRSHTYFGTGAGLSLETKAGIFNLTWAIGKRDDSEINLRQSKVHLGFVNYF